MLPAAKKATFWRILVINAVVVVFFALLLLTLPQLTGNAASQDQTATDGNTPTAPGTETDVTPPLANPAPLPDYYALRCDYLPSVPLSDYPYAWEIRLLKNGKVETTWAEIYAEYQTDPSALTISHPDVIVVKRQGLVYRGQLRADGSMDFSGVADFNGWVEYRGQKAALRYPGTARSV